MRAARSNLLEILLVRIVSSFVVLFCAETERAFGTYATQFFNGNVFDELAKF